MPEQWMYDVLGDEARARPGFEDDLARELQRGWRRGRAPWRPLAWAAAAAAAVFVVGVAVLATDGNKQIAPADTTLPATVTTATPPDPSAVAPYVAIGDSVMVGAEQLLADAGVRVFAAESRGPTGTLDVAANEVASGTIGAGSTVLIHVGTNAPLTDDALEDILAALPTEVDRIVFMTLAAPAGWIEENNTLIRALPGLDPRVDVADWATSSTQVELCPDGIHVSCSEEARQFYADYVLRALDATGEVPSTTATSVETSTSIDTPQLSGVELYLTSLAERDYSTAARLLNEGGLSLEDRADIRPLFRPEFGLVANQTNSDAVAAALEKWCAVAWCVTPIEVTDLDDGRWTKRAVFPTPFGSQAALFTDYVFEGQEGVTGLPPMRPIGGGDAMVVNCPTDAVQVVAWADLDGDGWLEQLIGRSVGDAGFSDEDNTENFVITTCGTALRVEPFAITGDSLAIYPVNPTLTGGDMVLIGFLEGYANGGVYSFDGQRLVQVQGPDGPATFAFAPFIAALPAAETFGCAVGADGGTVLVNRIYRLIGGNELSNSTSMELTTVEIITGVSTSTTFDLPEQAAEAGEALIGFCNGLPIQTY